MTITFKVCEKVKENTVESKEFKVENFIKDELKKRVDSDRYLLHQQIENSRSNEEIKLETYKKLKDIKDNSESRLDDQFDKTIILGTSCTNDLHQINYRYSSFIYSAYQAYSNHYHLIIRPDNIWLAIMTQFSIYVNKNNQELRDKFVDFSEKKTLVVTSEYPILKAPFDKLTMKLTNQISENIKDPSLKDWVIPSFSTTTESDKVVFSSVLMSTLKSYFNYSMSTCCGLPKVTMQGTLDDWVNLKERVVKLIQYNNKEGHIKKWVKYLNPVMDKFIESISGNPDTTWWNKIVHSNQSSGNTALDGWLTVFCLFDNDGNFQDSYNTSKLSKLLKSWPTIDSMAIPNGYVSSPILLTDADGTQYNSQLYSGHFASRIENNSSIIPSLDWFIIANMD